MAKLFQNLLERIRSTIRFVAGVTFWFNALLLVNMTRPSLDALSSRIGLNPSEAALIVFFCAMAILNGYGFVNFGLDLLYIWAFPFIFAYRTVVLVFKLLRVVTRVVLRFSPKPLYGSEWRALVAKLLPHVEFARVADVQAAPAPTATASVPVPAQTPAEPSATDKRKTWLLSFTSFVTYPFTAFSVAWCLLIAVTNHRPLLWIATAVVSFHVVRFLITVVATAASANKLLSGAERRLLQYAEAQISAVRHTNLDSVQDQGLSKSVASVILIRACALLVVSRAEITYGAICLAGFIYVLVYLRLALLFGFLYLAIAKLQDLPFTLPDSMTLSFIIPLSFDYFPRSNLIQITEFVHSAVVTLLGLGVVQAYLRRKLDGFRDVAERLWTALDSEEVNERIKHFWTAKSAGTQPPKSSAAATGG